MTRHFGLTYDYRCPYARIAHDHVVAGLRAGADWDVTFLPFSLGQAHVAEGEPPVWERPDVDTGLLALQASIAVRDTQPERFLDVHHALFEHRHAAAGQLTDARRPDAGARRGRRRRRRRVGRGRQRTAAGHGREGAHGVRRVAHRVGRADVRRRRRRRVRPPARAARRRRRRWPRARSSASSTRSSGRSSTSSSTPRSPAEADRGAPSTPAGCRRRCARIDRWPTLPSTTQDERRRGADVAPGEGPAPVVDVRDRVDPRPPAGLRPPAGPDGAGRSGTCPGCAGGSSRHRSTCRRRCGSTIPTSTSTTTSATSPCPSRARCASCSTWPR